MEEYVGLREELKLLIVYKFRFQGGGYHEQG